MKRSKDLILQGLLCVWFAAVAVIVASSVIADARLSTSAFLLVVGSAPAVIMYLLHAGAAPPTVAEVLYAAANHKDGQS